MEGPDKFVVAHLRQLEQKVDALTEVVGEVKRRLTSLECSVAVLHGDFADQSNRFDQVEARLSQIERCLELRRI